jgi:hypothetical protein
LILQYVSKTLKLRAKTISILLYCSVLLADFHDLPPIALEVIRVCNITVCKGWVPGSALLACAQIPCSAGAFLTASNLVPVNSAEKREFSKRRFRAGLQCAPFSVRQHCPALRWLFAG